MRISIWLAAALFIGLPHPGGATTRQSPGGTLSSPTLDWAASRRMVHVDNVDARKTGLFEGARRRWLEALRKPGEAMPDGRPLIWSGDHGDVRTYFTFYPFASWAELDARAAVAKRAQEAVGKAAVEDYDSGDAALVPPHCSEIWLRLTEMDIESPAAKGLTELSAREGVLEFREMPVGSDTALDAAWSAVRRTLEAGKSPLSCRVYWDLYGRGDLVLFWLASDGAALDSAGPLGPSKSPDAKEAARALDAAAPLRDRIRVRQRADLSNLTP